MSVETLTVEMSVKVPLHQLWEAFKDLHHLMPRLLPGFVESSRIIGGTVAGGGGVGSVRDCKFSSGEVPGISWTKELIEEVDDQKHIFAYKVVDGEVLEKCSSFRVTWHFKSQIAGAGTDVSWAADILPLPMATMPEGTPNSNEGNRGGDPAVAMAEAGRRNSLYRESAQLLMKQLETHLMVTGEYSQPSAKERLRDDLLLN